MKTFKLDKIYDEKPYMLSEHDSTEEMRANIFFFRRIRMESVRFAYIFWITVDDDSHNKKYINERFCYAY